LGVSNISGKENLRQNSLTYSIFDNLLNLWHYIDRLNSIEVNKY